VVVADLDQRKIIVPVYAIVAVERPLPAGELEQAVTYVDARSVGGRDDDRICHWTKLALSG